MKVRSLEVHQFRSFAHIAPIQFPSAPTLVLLAPNASGKTNLLEAIVMMLRGKSFRSPNRECVMWGKDNFVVRGEVDYGEGDMSIAVRYDAPARKVHVEENTVPVSPITFFSHYPIVIFLPEDAFLFSRGPSGRRNFINSSLASSREYLSSVVQYHRVLRQRNAALRGANSPADLSSWTDLLVEYAQSIWRHRELFISYLAAHVPELYRQMSGEKSDIEILFVPGAPNRELFRSFLDESWEYEKRYRYTLYGPHRDDIRVLYNGKDVGAAMSRGQMRGLVIACKIAAFRYMKQLLGQDPLLLFDEVLGELDPDRQRDMFKYLPASQTILTCTAIPEEVKKQDNVYVLDVRPLGYGS